MSRSRDVRAHILEEATRQFAAKGFDGTSLQAIADEVDITKPSLLYHYSSKADLREQVLEELLSHWNSVLPRLLKAATSGDDQFKGLIEAVISFFSKDPDRARLLIREMMDRPERMRGLLNEYLAPWMAILSDYIDKGKKDGTVYPDLDPTAYTTNVIFLVVGGIATSGVMSTLIDEHDGSEVNADQIDEIVRLAGAALFIDGQPDETASAPGVAAGEPFDETRNGDGPEPDESPSD